MGRHLLPAVACGLTRPILRMMIGVAGSPVCVQRNAALTVSAVTVAEARYEIERQ